MVAEWTPPPAGSPCWLQLFATNVPRARKFYEEVFGWKIRDEQGATEFVHFTTPDPNGPSGGIMRVAETEHVKTKGSGGVVLYLTVDDLTTACEKIIQAGGTKTSEVQKQGENAVMQHFEDTEGNYFGIHQWRESK